MSCSTRIFDDPVVSLTVSVAFIFLWFHIGSIHFNFALLAKHIDL